MSEQHDAGDNRNNKPTAPMVVNSAGDVSVPPADEPTEADTKPEAQTGKADIEQPKHVQTEPIRAQSSSSTTAADESQTAATSLPLTGTTMPDVNASSQPTVAPVVIKQSGGKGVALGALVLSILALGASGFLFVQGQNVLKSQDQSFSHKLDAAGLGESKNALLLQSNLAKIDELSQELATLQQQSKAQGDEISAANKAYQELVKTRADWLVDEVEATLNLAAQQLLISGNVPVAVSVLESLDARLARFDQPQLLPIKQAISSDLTQLKNRPYLDVASVSLRLNRLETAVSGLPLIIDNTLKPGSNTPAPVNPNATWWQRAWQNTLNSLKGMVEVRRVNSNDAMLMSPDQLYFVRENLRMRLMDARLALMQRSGEVYASDLNTAEATVKQYFDGQSAATQSWLKELAQLKTMDVQSAQQGNVLSASLAAVRSYQKQAGMDMSTALPDLGASAPTASAPANAATSPQAAVPTPKAEAKTASEAHQGGHAL